MPKAFDFSSAPFDRLRPTEIERVKASVDVAFFRKDQVILHPGDMPDFYHVVIKGLVEERAGDEIVTVHGSGDGFDSNILLHSACRHEFVVREEAICYVLPIEEFIELTANNAQFGLYFFQTISQKLDHLGQRHSSAGQIGAITVRVGDCTIHPPAYVAPETTLHQAAIEMDAKRQRALLVNGDGHVGIVTGVDLTRAAVRDRKPVDTRIADIAKFDIVSVDKEDFLFEAAHIMGRRNIRHVVVREDGRIVGIIDAATVLSSLANQSDSLGASIDRAETIKALSEANERITMLVRQLHEHGTKIGYITDLSTDLHHRVTTRLFDLVASPTIREHTCLMVMGSEGRGEYLLKTDQDNGLIIEDGWSDPELAPFRQRLTAALIEIGFPPCPGDIMVSNDAWSKQVVDWRSTIRDWVLKPSDEALMNVAILFDASAFAGRTELLLLVRQQLLALTTENKAFQARFAKAIDMFETPVGFMSRLVTERGEHRGALDIKKGGIFPLMHGVRALVLERRLEETSTAKRIRGLQQAGVFDKEFASSLVDAFSFMTGLRLSARLERMRIHQSPNNFVKPDEISKIERDLLKDSLLIVKKLKELVRHHFNLSALT